MLQATRMLAHPHGHSIPKLKWFYSGGSAVAVAAAASGGGSLKGYHAFQGAL